MNLAQIQLKDLFEEGTNFNACWTTAKGFKIEQVLVVRSKKA